jgi:PAS domain S-box-containing protein
MSDANPPGETPALTAGALRVLERIADPFYALDAQWRIVYANPPALAAFGRTLDEVEGLVVWDAYPTTRDPLFHDHLQQVARERRGVSFEAQSPTLKRWFEVRCHPCLDGVAVYLRDIHDRKLAEQALKEHAQALHDAERRLSLLLESIDDHLVSYDHEWRYTFVNEGAARLLGKPKEELLGHSIWDLFPEAVGNQYWRDLHQAVAEMRPITAEFYYRAWDRWFENRIYPSSDGVTVFSSDISARKRREHALAERERALIAADQRKDEFLATLAHELRNPLAPIRQAAYIARSEQASAAQVRWSHDVVERQVDHMSRLLDDLLDVSRISRGTIELRKEPVALAAVIETAIETARPLIDARGHALSVHNHCGALQIEADANRLAQVISNLLSNAAKYTDPGGRIELHAKLDEGQLMLRVKDNGIGIAEQDRESVFDMFTQIQSTIDRSEGGLGIGLALAKGIVELHGGTIEARSDGLGHGSEFVLRLPVVIHDVPAGDGAAPAVAPAAQPLKVLVADDNADAAQTLTMLLGLDGHDVKTATDGYRAVDIARDFHPDVVLLDIGMPGLNGFEVASTIRREPWSRSTRIIAITGWGKDQDKQRSKDAGFDEHLTKPVDPDALKPLMSRR